MPAQGGHDAHDGEHEERDPARVDAAEARRHRVAAGGQDLAAVARLAQHDVADDDGHRRSR